MADEQEQVETTEEELEEGQEQAEITEEEFDAERAMATIKAQRKSEKALQKELAAAAKKLEQFEKAEKERQEAEMSEAEKLAAKLAEAEARLEQQAAEMTDMLISAAVEREAVRADFHDPAEAYALADLGNVTIEDGKVAGVEEAIKELAEAKPHLIKTPKKADLGADAGGKGGKGSKEAAKEDQLRRRYGL